MVQNLPQELYITSTIVWFRHDHLVFSHILHILYPLYVFCFKPFKTTFIEEKDETMIRIDYNEPNKILLTRWANKTLNQSLMKQNVMKSWFQDMASLILRPWMTILGPTTDYLDEYNEKDERITYHMMELNTIINSGNNLVLQNYLIYNKNHSLCNYWK